jgi:hypothetical protein
MWNAPPARDQRAQTDRAVVEPLRYRDGATSAKAGGIEARRRAVALVDKRQVDKRLVDKRQIAAQSRDAAR